MSVEYYDDEYVEPEYKVPYATWSELSKIAFGGMEESYKYDLALYAPGTAEANAMYRTTPELRKNVYSSFGEFKYMSPWSTDQCAVFTCKNVLMLAFRGTDFDPNRYLGYVPIDYDAKLMKLFKEWKVSATSAEEGLAKLPYSEIKAKCECDASLECGEKEFHTRENALGKVSELYCSIDPRTRIETQQHSDALKGGLPAFKIKGEAAIYSDCQADVHILNYATPGNRWAISSLAQDAKHKQALITAKQALEQFKKTTSNPVVICTGHSLGGGMGFFTFLSLVYEKYIPIENAYFAGFNSAILGNYDKLAMEVKKTTPYEHHAISYRNVDDGVSKGLSPSDVGKLTVINLARHYTRGRLSWYGYDTLTHGFWIFKTCQMTTSDEDYSFGTDFPAKVSSGAQRVAFSRTSSVQASRPSVQASRAKSRVVSRVVTRSRMRR
jgi:hypothetical protein